MAAGSWSTANVARLAVDVDVEHVVMSAPSVRNGPPICMAVVRPPGPVTTNSLSKSRPIWGKVSLAVMSSVKRVAERPLRTALNLLEIDGSAA